MNLFFQYPEDGTAYGEGEKQVPYSPHGMSGGGVWALNVRPGEVWDPSKMRLVGIVVESHVRFDWVRAAKIKRWIEVLFDGESGVSASPQRLTSKTDKSSDSALFSVNARVILACIGQNSVTIHA